MDPELCIDMTLWVLMPHLAVPENMPSISVRGSTQERDKEKQRNHSKYAMLRPLVAISLD
jgi:hypothetical protein